MRLRYIIIILLTILSIVPATAQKKAAQPKMKVLYKNAKTAMKVYAGQDPPKAALLQALARPELTNKEKAKIYYTTALLAQNSNAVQNQKAYLKQMKTPNDSIALFATILEMYNYLELCDSVDAIPNDRGRINLKYHRKSESMKQKHRSNLLTGGKFFLKKLDYANALPYMEMYLSTCKDSTDADFGKVSYWATICSFNLKNYVNTLKHSIPAIQFADEATKPILQEYRVRCYQILKSTQAYERELQVGVHQYPNYDFFFVNLIDWYYQNHKYDEGLAKTDSLLSINKEKAVYWYAKSLMYLGKQDFDNCIAFSDACIALDPEYVDAYYDKGIAYCNLALIAQEEIAQNKASEDWKEQQKRIQDLYLKARPCMEFVRKKQPENKARWAQPLYRIYLYLNLGAEFDEIDKLLKENQ